MLKNSVALIETSEWRIFLMKDLVAVEEAQKQGAKIVEVDVKSLPQDQMITILQTMGHKLCLNIY